MPYLATAVVLVGALAALNLVLTLGVLRRLREQQPGAAAPGRPPPRITLAPGERPAAFAAATVDGAPLDPAALAGSLVGFFSPACEPCHERVPEFVAHARRAGLPAGKVLAVLVGDEEETAGLASALLGSARLALEPPRGPVQRAFDVQGLPALCLLDADGVAVATGTDLVTFPVPVPG